MIMPTTLVSEEDLADPAMRARSGGSGALPTAGIAALVPELGVSNIEASLDFWCGALGFSVAYDRPKARFAFLQRGSVQVMLCACNGRWETGILDRPFGRGLNLQITVDSLAPVIDALQSRGHPLFEDVCETWYRTGAVAYGQREFLVQAPDGYLLRFAERLGIRPLSAGEAP